MTRESMAKNLPIVDLNSDFRSFLTQGINSIVDGVAIDHKSLITNRSEDFVAQVIKDANGNPITNEPVHKFMHRFIRKAQSKGFNRYLILGAFGHGKTEQMCLGYALYRIALDPNILIKIIHVSDTEAVSRVRAIRDYITKDDDFKRLAPHILPTNIWGSQRFIVNRGSMAKDGTCEAYGVLSTAIGGRATLLIFDDPQDLKTTIIEPSTRVRIEDTFKNIWLTRLIPGLGEAIVMMNKWHEQDLANFIKHNPIWSWMSIAVSEDKNNLEYRDSFGSHRILPLWTKFGKIELENKHKELGERDYNRGYRLIPYSDADKMFPDYEGCCIYGITPQRQIEDQRDWLFVGGIDIAGKARPGTVVSVVAAHRQTGLKVPVGLVSMRGTKDLVPQMVRFHREFGVDNYVVENNGVQSSIIDMAETALGEGAFRKYGIKIEGFLTGSNKADPQTGLPSLQKEFENKEWLWCFPVMPTTDSDLEQNTWNRAFFEFKHYPFWETADTVMATWFAREGIKKILRGGGGPNVW